jgi:hypothetical protein
MFLTVKLLRQNFSQCLFRNIYGCIESGYPAIVTFSVDDTKEKEEEEEKGGEEEKGPFLHAIPLFGHTFNEDTWVQRAESYFHVGPETKCIPSESWTSMYIAHDDNWGSNYCIPRNYLRTKRYCDKPDGNPNYCQMGSRLERVTDIFGAMPKEIKLNHIEAEAIGVGYLYLLLAYLPSIDDIWTKRLTYFTVEGQVVIRPVLIDSIEYLHHLKQIKDWNCNLIANNTISILEEFFLQYGEGESEKVWMVELSVPELFSANKRKVGEVLLRADIEPKIARDFETFVFARFPGFFAFFADFEDGEIDKPAFEYIPSGLKGHVELFGEEES